MAIAYVLRGGAGAAVLRVPLAYALDPLVDWLEERKVPRAVGGAVVMLGIATLLAVAPVLAIPHVRRRDARGGGGLSDAARAAARRGSSRGCAAIFKLKLPHTMGELGVDLADEFQSELPTTLSTAAPALFGTLSYVAVVAERAHRAGLRALPPDRFRPHRGARGGAVPRRFCPPVDGVARQIHSTLGGWVRGQLTANIVLGALYAAGLRVVDIRLAVPIGVLTGMLAFVPYIGFGPRSCPGDGDGDARLARGLGTVVGVAGVMLGVQLLDGFVITPRVVGRSVGLSPLRRW